MMAVNEARPVLPGAPAGDSTAARQALGYTLFRQDGSGYLLPGAAVLGVIGIEHLQPLPTAVAGWAGTVTVRSRDAVAQAPHAVPVLDVAALLGHGGAASAVILLRLAGGPLGIAVERVAGLRPLAAGAFRWLSGAPGVVGGLVQDDEVLLALAPEYLAALRRAAVGTDAQGRLTPRPLAWAAASRSGAAAAGVVATPRAGELLLVLAARLADDTTRNLAVPLRVVRAVAHAGTLRPGPPGLPAVVGYRPWGQLPVAAVDLAQLGATPGERAPRYAVLVALGGGRGSFGAALLVDGVRGVQRLDQVRPPEDATSADVIVSLGEAQGRRRGDSIGIGGAPLAALGQTAGVPVAVLSPERLAAALGAPLG
jgi:chemotaxis signal transduction protein